MKKFIKILIFFALFTFALSLGNSETWSEKNKRVRKEYKDLIRKCEKIDNPKKKKKCQKKFLKYYNKVKEKGYRSTMLSCLDPAKWEDILQDISKNDKESYLRIKALSRLNDQKTLLDIFNSTESKKKDRSSALWFLTDKDALIKIAKNDTFEDFRSMAARKIHDQETLKWIINNDKSEFARKAAIKNLKDQELLEQLIYKNPDEKIKKLAIMNLDPEISSELLKKIYNSTSPDISRHIRNIAGIKLLLSDPEILKIHGKLRLEYKNNYIHKTYRTIKKSSETIIVKITNSVWKTILYKSFRGRALKKEESLKFLTETPQLQQAVVNFKLIRNLLKSSKKG